MSEIKVEHGDWVVVCDGAKALIMENVGNWLKPSLKTREVYNQPDPSTHELGSDAPGRSFSSVGSARSAIEQTDWHDEAERAFLEQLADRLHAVVVAGQVKGLVIVAAPRALGVLRQAYSPHVKAVLRGEVHKDFVKLPVHEIEKHLAAA
jgi:protein required for attachment to host cells